jgi:hypothetical protein
MFSALAQPTGDLGEVTLPETSVDRAVMMPTRKQTREQDRRDRIAKERRERIELLAEQARNERKWLAGNYEPPPS